jgi:hypothetical protein
MKSLMMIFLFGIHSLQLVLPQAIAEERKTAPSRQKVIDFEGDLVEGVNQRPLDSLNTVSEVDKRRKKAHLYRKRKGFKTEVRETLREMRYAE